jgi:hypothetical protein
LALEERGRLFDDLIVRVGFGQAIDEVGRVCMHLSTVSEGSVFIRGLNRGGCSPYWQEEADDKCVDMSGIDKTRKDVNSSKPRMDHGDPQ